MDEALFCAGNVDCGAVGFAVRFSLGLPLQMLVDEVERETDRHLTGFDLERDVVPVNLSVADRHLLFGGGSGGSGHSVALVSEDQDSGFAFVIATVDERAGPLAGEVGG